MPKSWITHQSITPPVTFQTSIGGHPLVAQTLVRRGIDDLSAARGFLNPAFYLPSSPTELPNLSRAADRIEAAIQKKEAILIWGDFDVDGQTATTLLVESLRDLGADISYHIPVRATENHGIQVKVLEKYLEQFPQTRLIITCDTGIAEHKAVEFAQSHGVDVIITDHHELSKTLPKVTSVVNPHLLAGGHPLRSIPGVGVAYKLVEELFIRAGKATDSRHYLDLVALGIVADVAELTGDTRYLLQLGLRTLRSTPRLGLKVLYETAAINPAQIDEEHIGFNIAPRLNALGRLSDANPIVEFFTTKDLTTARILSNQLEGLNQRRKLLAEQVYQGALAQIERDPSLLNSAVLVLVHPGWPTGVIGIVASRLTEQFELPAILLNLQENEMAVGSARSIEGINIRDALATQDNLLLGFGGHAGAAGLSLLAKDIPEFRTRLSRTIRQMAVNQDLEPKLFIDASVQLSELSIDLIDEIERLAPFGTGNPPLVLVCEDVKLSSKSEIGSAKEHLRLVIEDRDGFSQEIIWWQGAREILPAHSDRFDLAFIPGTNTFRGERKLQLQWVDFRPNRVQGIKVETQPIAVEIVDFRNEPNHLNLLDAIRSRGEIQVWAEGRPRSKVKGLNRYQLKPGSSLAIWTTPPGLWELQAAVERVKPIVIYLFGHSTEIDEPKPFLELLAGLVKHTINKKDGITTIEELAANTAQKEGTVLMGLLWLEAKGKIGFIQTGVNENETQRRIVVSKGTDIGRSELTEITRELISMLDETAAFRNYLGNTRCESLKKALIRKLETKGSRW